MLTLKFEILNVEIHGYCTFLENSDLQWTEKEPYCNIMDRFHRGKSTGMYTSDEKCIMSSFSLEKKDL